MILKMLTKNFKAMTFITKILLLFRISPLFILIACNNNAGNKISAEQTDKTNLEKTLSDLEQKGLASKKIIDTVFLGYRFGMTQSEVLAHTKNLVEQGKLKTDYSGKYYFEIDSKLGTKYKGNVFAEYFENKLISIGVIFNDEPNPILVFSDLADLYESKYGTYDYMDNPSKEFSIYNKIWIRNNLKIKIRSGISDALVDYIDLRYEKQKMVKDSLDKVKEADELKKGL